MKATSLLTAFVVASTMALANGPDGPRVVVINQKNSGTFKVIYEGVKTGDVTMTIRSESGKVVFVETTRNVAGFMRPVNFEGMSAGNYSIEIMDASGKQIQNVAYKNETAVTNVHVSKIAEEGKYLLAVANDGIEQINVRIFDGANNLVHNENMTINGNFGLVYNLKSVAGVPTFEVTDKTGNIRTIK
ncbi:MAG: hypothetical protein K2U26_17270 [Cyclobacteriaceae bacterium]|nr:hypothetical protein [Cyclobacteriaceae bacterium]